MALTDFNYYQILGVNSSASEEEIKSAFKTLAKKYHPDKNAGNKVYEEHFKKINIAYQTLSDREKRKKYDLKLYYKSPQPFAKPTHSTRKPNPFQPSRSRPMNKKTASPEDKKKNRKYASIAISALVVFGIAVLIFYNYMNGVMAKRHLEDGKKMQALNKNVSALELYSLAINYDPDLREAYLLRAELLIKGLNDYQTAAHDYSKALEQKEDAAVFFARAKCYIRLKKYEEGVRDLDQALCIDPSLDTAYFYRAEVNNYALKKYSEALKDYEKAATLNPRYEAAILGKGLTKQGLMDYQGALKDFSAVIQINPEEGSYYYYRGYTYMLLNHKDSACSDWFQSSRLNFHEARRMVNQHCADQ